MDAGEYTEEMGMQLGELEGVIADEDGYSAESEAAALLEGLGIFEEDHQKEMKNFSGGEKLRVLLAQALFGKPECLLLDEPTNHLDMDSISWLENFLLTYEGILVVISHDRHFLNAVVHTSPISIMKPLLCTPAAMTIWSYKNLKYVRV